MADIEVALVLKLEATLSKFEKQMARARKTGTDTANVLQNQFARSNTRMAKSAQESANSIGREMDRLRAKYDPVFAASKRYEAAVEEINMAHRVGALSAQQQKVALAALKTEYSATAVASGAAATSAARVVSVSRGGRAVLQNTTSQIADMAVQWEMGTSGMRIMGQQMPQLLAGFGMLSGPIGLLAPLLATIAAIGFPVAAFLMSSGKNADESAPKIKSFADAFDAAESALSKANAAITRAVSGDLKELNEIYGDVSDSVINLVQSLARLELEKAITKTGAAWDKFLGDNTAVVDLFKALDDSRGVVVDMRREIGALQDQVDAGISVSTNLDQISDLLESIRLERSGEAIADAFHVDAATIKTIEYAKKALDEAMAAGDPVKLMESFSNLRIILNTIASGPLAKMGDEMAPMENLLRRAQAQAERLRDGAASVSFDAATTSATRMADEIQRAVNAMHDLKTQGISDLETAQIRYEYRDDPLGRAGALAGAKFDKETAPVRNEGFENAGEESYYNTQRQAAIDRAREIARLGEAARPTSRGSGGSGGTGGSGAFDTSDRELQTLERQIEMLGKTRAEIAALTVKYRLLDEAKRKGVDLDKVQTDSGQTLRDEIENQAAAVGRLADQYEKAQDSASYYDSIQTDLKQGMLDTIFEAENLSDVFRDLAKSIARAGIEAALFGTGPLAGLFSGSGKSSSGGGSDGVLGGIVGAIGSLFSFDGGGYTWDGPRSGGLDGKGGRLALLHPQETVVDHTRIGMDKSGGVAMASRQTASRESFGVRNAGLGGIPSFEGGGYTWDGARSGGLDGKGGQLALLHPKETIVDHTKGQMAGDSKPVELIVRAAEGITIEQVRGESINIVQAGLTQYDRGLPDRVAGIQNNPRLR